MRSNGPLANKKVAIGGHRWPWVARSSGVAESGRLVRRMSPRVDPAAIAEEARAVRLDAVLGPPRRSVPVGDSSTPESRTLTPLIMVRIQVPQPGSRTTGAVFAMFKASDEGNYRSCRRDAPQEEQAFDIVDEIRQSDLRLRSRDPDGSDEQTHPILLLGEDMLDARTDF